MTFELNEILEQHKLWLETNGMQGILANLEGADLSGADLNCANLSYADLSYADLRHANLLYANLTGANLTGTILDKKTEKQPEVAFVKSDSTIRSEIEAIAKKHGMKVASLTLELL